LHRRSAGARPARRRARQVPVWQRRSRAFAAAPRPAPALKHVPFSLVAANETCSTSTMPDHLLVEKQGHVVTVTLNRPEARNAFSPEMMARMADAWDLIDGDPDVRVAILTGAAGHFCAGADLKLMSGGWNKQDDDPWRARF